MRTLVALAALIFAGVIAGTAADNRLVITGSSSVAP